MRLGRCAPVALCPDGRNPLWCPCWPSLPSHPGACLANSPMSAGLSCLPCHFHTQTSGTWLGRGASPSATGPSGCQHCAPTGQVQAGQPIQLHTASSGGESQLTLGCVLIAVASPTDPKPTLWGHVEQGGGLSVFGHVGASLKSCSGSPIPT